MNIRSIIIVAFVFVLAAQEVARAVSESASDSVTVVKKAKSIRTKSHDDKAVRLTDDDANDEYARAASVPDPIEPFNRGTFWVNHQIYRYIFRPVSRTYDTVVPSVVRRGIFNVFDNLEFPKRFVNDLLQGRLPQAGMESEKFVVNSTAGVGGIMKVSDRIPALADLPRPDTGQTFAKWGIPHGAYVVVPIFGPRSARDTVGLAGDIALSPVFWVSIFFPAVAWIPAVTTPDSVRTLHDRLSAYDAVTENTMDRYLAARSAYIQNRTKAASQ